MNNNNNHLQKILLLAKAIARQIWSWFRGLDNYKKIIVLLVLMALIFGIVKLLSPKDESLTIDDQIKGVTIATVADLSNKTSPVPLAGQVTSVTEAVIRAESSGPLTRVYKKLGDRVVAGQVIAEFENSGERASVLQAEGAYESAKAARDIALINTANTSVGINDTKANTINAISSAFVTMDDIVRTKTDIAFADPRSDTPRLRVLVPDSILQTKIENQRREIERMLVDRFSRNLTLNNDSDLLIELQKVQAETQIVKNYLDDLNLIYVKSLADSSFSQSALDGQKSVVGLSRTTISGTISALSGAKVALQNGLASQDIAGKTTGDKSGTTASADAAVKSAQGAYLAALSRLEKTIIRSPITGTLNSLSIETGDFVTPSAQVAVVSNNGALEVVAYVSGDDSKRISTGSVVKINGTIKGVVTRMASAIDPVTKKIEVRIGIVEDKANLINGQSVRVEVSNAETNNTLPNPPINASMIKIPLSAVKITPRGSFVFVISNATTTASILESVTVETGTLLGEEVQIVSGLTSDMSIVKDARGLKEGDKVKINN